MLHAKKTCDRPHRKARIHRGAGEAEHAPRQEKRVLETISTEEKRQNQMTVLYKLTDENMKTRGGFQYVLGVQAEAKGKGRELCSGALLHAYEHPLLAVLHNPIHADFRKPRLFKAETKCKLVKDGAMKCGVKKLMLIEEMPLPAITTEQRIRYAIGCALTVYADPGFGKWAQNWLNKTDRSRSAWVAWAAWAAEAAARSAQAAAAAARAAAEAAARAAAEAAEAAAAAAQAAEAAEAAADLVKIAKWAVSDVIEFNLDTIRK